MLISQYSMHSTLPVSALSENIGWSRMIDFRISKVGPKSKTKTISVLGPKSDSAWF